MNSVNKGWGKTTLEIAENCNLVAFKVPFMLTQIDANNSRSASTISSYFNKKKLKDGIVLIHLIGSANE